MPKVIVSIAGAAMLAGCGASPDPAADHAAAPPPELLAAIPSAAAVAASGPAASASPAYQPTAKDALNAGVAMVAARDICGFSSVELARFATYSEWIVKSDPQRKALFISAANEARKLRVAIIRQGRQQAYRQEACPKVRRLLSMIEAGSPSPPAARTGADAP